MTDLTANALAHWTGPLGLPDFVAVHAADFPAAFDAAIAAHAAEIAAIAADPDAPSIDNTLKRLELSGRPLSRISALFFLLAGADTSPKIQEIERAIAPKLARHSAMIAMDPALFARIEALHEARASAGLDAETRRALEK
ncbi:MAG: peptidase M3, partial [Rhizobiaceae bacterium]